MRHSRRAALLASTILCSLLLAGCAVLPTPLTQDEVASFADDKLARVIADQEPLSGSVDLYEAMARALKYNLDFQVEVAEKALRVRELDLSHYALLPNMVANGGYAARNRDSGGTSIGIIDRTESLRPSTSQEKRIFTDDIGFSWNILDFGLSYVRARQAADQVLIAEELKRKVMHRIVEDVRTAFWRAVSADRLVGRLRGLEARTQAALASTRAMASDGKTSPITALTYERELVEIRRTVEELQRELSVAKSQLAALMNVPPDSKFTLAGRRHGTRSSILGLSTEEMIRIAVTHRPELLEVAYKLRINEHEAHAALLELLPGLQVYANSNYDSNAFTFYNDWVSWGAKASWNLLKVFQYPARRDVIEGQDELLDAQALAVTMAIMTQVHVSRVRFLFYQRELRTASEYLDVQNRLLHQMRVEASADRVSEQTLIREEMNTLVAEVKRDVAYADLQNSYANVFASLGLDPYADEIDLDLSVDELAAQLKQLWFERGQIRDHLKLAAATP